jgi:hypothetical protein
LSGVFFLALIPAVVGHVEYWGTHEGHRTGPRAGELG